MRWSNAFIPTLRDDPSDAEAASHRLLVRAGFIRQLMAGTYSILPLGERVRAKIIAVIREEMNAIGGQEFTVPKLQPRDVWDRTGRTETMSDILYVFADRRGAGMVLGPTAEEIFATLALELTSYRQLPQLWYQVDTKFRDEPRPKAGVLRVREFTMKDSYSFDIDEQGLDRAFDRHHEAYTRIYRRLGLQAVPVAASSGAMGGAGSVEFMVRAPAGEDDVATCDNCMYAANVEKATSRLATAVDDEELDELEPFPTPGVRTIVDLVDFPGGASADRQIKTLVYLLDEEPALVLMRGDHDLVEQKLQDGTGAIALRPAHPDEIRDLMGADAGSLGAVGAVGLRVLADHALMGRTNMVTGANRDEYHVRGVSLERDVSVDDWLDLRRVGAGEPCPRCGEPLGVFTAIEVGHIFKLGTSYAEVLGVTVLDENGEARPLVMGSYGIGVERSMAAIAECHHDEKGLVWPLSVAPYQVVVTVVSVADAATREASEVTYERLVATGLETLLDDRDERPGVKFTDAELIGIPYRITVGPKGLGEGVVEITERATGSTMAVPVEQAVVAVAERFEA